MQGAAAAAEPPNAFAAKLHGCRRWAHVRSAVRAAQTEEGAAAAQLQPQQLAAALMRAGQLALVSPSEPPSAAAPFMRDLLAQLALGDLAPAQLAGVASALALCGAAPLPPQPWQALQLQVGQRLGAMDAQAGCKALGAMYLLSTQQQQLPRARLEQLAGAAAAAAAGMAADELAAWSSSSLALVVVVAAAAAAGSTAEQLQGQAAGSAVEGVLRRSAEALAGLDARRLTPTTSRLALCALGAAHAGGQLPPSCLAAAHALAHKTATTLVNAPQLWRLGDAAAVLDACAALVYKPFAAAMRTFQGMCVERSWEGLGDAELLALLHACVAFEEYE